MKKRGISLIVLVITIIVIVILGTAVIVTFAKNNPIEAAKVALLKGDAKTFNEELTLTFADEKLNDKEFDPEIINAASVEDMKKYIPSFSEKYYGKLCIVNGKLAYVKGNVTEKEKTSLEEVGLVPGSYITEEEAANIKTKAEDAQIPSDAITTDITEYIDGIPEDYAEKFTIYQGNLYYRYEKTTYEERKELHIVGIPFLPGDANENGTLDNEDAEMIADYGLFYVATPNNTAYICDIDYDNLITNGDATYVEDVIFHGWLLEDYIDMNLQDPDRIQVIGDYWMNLSYMCSIDVINRGVDAVGYNELVKYYPDMLKEIANRTSMCDGVLYLRYDKLTEKERICLLDAGFEYLLGDGNCDGYVNSKDAEIITAIISGQIPTDVQREVLDINGDGQITQDDFDKFQLYLAGKIEYGRFAIRNFS